MEHITTIPTPPPRPLDGHKGTFGTVIVIGGSETMIGAPAIAAGAALRCGAGLVKIATSPGVLPFAIAIEPSATGIALRGASAGGDVAADVAAIEAGDPKSRAVLAVGPGIGQAEGAGELVLALLRGRRAMVLDADGLNLLARTGEPRPRGGPALVMTPHPGEFARLAEPMGITESPTDPDERPEAARRLAEAHGAIVVLKGHRTVVCDGQRVYVNRTGNPALATAGSGDVLTGAIAALMAGGLSPFDAAVLGVYVHGLAADGWADRHGPRGLLARELIDELPAALRAAEGG